MALSSIDDVLNEADNAAATPSQTARNSRVSTSSNQSTTPSLSSPSSRSSSTPSPTMARNESITITKKQHKDLTDKAADSTKLQKELDAERKEHDKTAGVLGKLKEKCQSLIQEKKLLRENSVSKDKEIERLEKLIGELQAALRKNGTVHESELNRDLKEQVFYAAKVYLFRNVKFLEDDMDAEDKSKLVIKFLPNGVSSLGSETEEEFAIKYKQIVNKGLQAAKQSVQADGKKAAIEWWKDHKALPTSQEIVDVLQMSEDELEKPENKTEKELFLWYYDQWLAAILPKEFWKPDIRYYNLMTDKIDIAGQQKVLVTVSSEAFGLLMWENCHKKWVNYCKLKDRDPKAVIPSSNKDPSYADHQALWSDGCAGQVKYGGWDVRAYVRFEELKKEVKARRKADEDSGYVGQKLAYKYMRAANKREGKSPQDDKKSKRRGNKDKPATAPPPKKSKILTVEDE